jgi:hypothetical protein
MGTARGHPEERSDEGPLDVTEEFDLFSVTQRSFVALLLRPTPFRASANLCGEALVYEAGSD